MVDPKICLFPRVDVLPCRIWSFYVRRRGLSRGIERATARPLGLGIVADPEKHTVSHMVFHAEFYRCWSNGSSMHRSVGKWAPHLTKSLKVIHCIGTDMDRSAAYDSLLVLHSNHGPFSGGLGRKTQLFPSPVYNSLRIEGTVGICVVRLRKTTIMDLSDVDKFVEFNREIIF